VDALRAAVERAQDPAAREAQSRRVAHEDWAYRCEEIARLADASARQRQTSPAAQRRTGT
jgi:hypothetical protein